MTEAERIDAALRRLHGGGDHAALSRLHEAASTLPGGEAAARFHLTHAWVHALVTGDADRVAGIEARLRTMGSL